MSKSLNSFSRIDISCVFSTCVGPVTTVRRGPGIPSLHLLVNCGCALHHCIICGMTVTLLKVLSFECHEYELKEVDLDPRPNLKTTNESSLLWILSLLKKLIEML